MAFEQKNDRKDGQKDDNKGKASVQPSEGKSSENRQSDTPNATKPEPGSDSRTGPLSKDGGWANPGSGSQSSEMGNLEEGAQFGDDIVDHPDDSLDDNKNDLEPGRDFPEENNED